MKRRKLLFVLFIIMLLTACGRPSEEKVRSQMEKYLYEKYGEEFVVDRIGMRSANEQKFYQAQIYPKSIIGTEKEDDDYYYASASINVNSFGKLDKETGDSFDIIQFNDGIENYLLPKAKELFGDRIRIKSDSKYKKNKNGTFYWAFQHDFIKAKEIIKTSKDYRIEFGIYIYIFDRINSEEEKEERREQIFEFIQYLKEEWFFEYLEMGIIFIDERVLAPSYTEYREKIEYSQKEERKIGNKIIYLPIVEFREKMSKVLEIEMNEMNEEDKLKSMNKILKSNLEVYRGSEYFRGSTKDSFWIESLGFLKEVDMHNGYEEAKEMGTLDNHYYKMIDDIEYYEFNHYILLEEEK